MHVCMVQTVSAMTKFSAVLVVTAWHHDPAYVRRDNVIIVNLGYRTQADTQATGNEREEEGGYDTMDRHRPGLDLSSNRTVLLLQLR